MPQMTLEQHLTTNGSGDDLVNRWAIEHYGFEDDPHPGAVPGSAQPAAAHRRVARHRAGQETGQPRTRQEQRRRASRWWPIMTKRPDPAWMALAVPATVLGIWLGVAGADISPTVTEVPMGIHNSSAR